MDELEQLHQQIDKKSLPDFSSRLSLIDGRKVVNLSFVGWFSPELCLSSVGGYPT
jgi:hypothetical protein